MLLRGQPSFEDLLEGEARGLGLPVLERGGGWLSVTPSAAVVPASLDLCFAQAIHLAPVEVSGESVNALATRLLDHFLASARDERFDSAWPCVFTTAAGLDGLGKNAWGASPA
jgi:23S rRNA (cytidine2498-2'-O)-methyltransferase